MRSRARRSAPARGHATVLVTPWGPRLIPRAKSGRATLGRNFLRAKQYSVGVLWSTVL